MRYTIKEVSRLLNIPATTLRYYDREGLLPFLDRRESGYRSFSEDDVAMLQMIECLKSTGMSIRDIRQYMDWVRQGEATLRERHRLLQERRRAVEVQIAELQEVLRRIDHTCWDCEAALMKQAIDRRP